MCDGMDGIVNKSEKTLLIVLTLEGGAMTCYTSDWRLVAGQIYLLSCYACCFPLIRVWSNSCFRDECSIYS